MANSKISALTSATTPLAGTETLPVVQSSTTKQVSIANLTAGRTVAAGGLNVTSTSDLGVNVTTTGTGNAASLILTNGNGTSAAGYSYVRFVNSQTSSQDWRLGTYGSASLTFVNATAGNIPASFDTSGNFSMALNNIYFSTAAKGVNFTANTPAAGMTSQLLNWYEEGTWTPNQGSGLTVVGAFTSSGTYTRVGRLVTVTGKLTGATSIACTAVGLLSSNLPFTSAATVIGTGGLINATVTSSGITWVNSTSKEVYSASAIAATGSIYFSVGYHI